MSVSTTATAFTFRVISKDYFDAPGSTITFSLSDRGGELYLTQSAKAYSSSVFSSAGVKAGFAHQTWKNQAQT